jgi:hypothetical protein
MNRNVFGVAIALVLSAIFATRITAQSAKPPWSPPSNVSQSGAASQARLVTAPDGTLHAIWWDAEQGAQYSYTTDSSGRAWVRPINLPDIFGRRVADTQTQQVTFTPPRDIGLAATTAGDMYVFWSNDDRELFSAPLQSGGLGEAVRLAESASSINVAADSTGGLHLAYVRPADTAAFPAGIYYRGNRSGSWSDASLVHASSYFRTIKPENAQFNVAGNAAGQVVAAWDAPQFEYSLYAASADNGTSWSEPQIVGGSTASSRQARVATTPAGEFLMISQDPSSGGCGYLQRRSSDGGATWTAPEKVLSALTPCNLDLTFMLANDRLWLIGRPQSQAENLISEVMLAVWDDSQWSAPTSVSLTFLDEPTNRTIGLGCLSVSLNGGAAALLGCDSANDIWAARNSIPLSDLIPQLQPVWSPLTSLSDRSAPAASEDLPALARDKQGKFFALWSQELAGSAINSALYATSTEDGRWTRTANILESPEVGASGTGKAIQPTLAIDGQDRAHAVWSSGTNGKIFYSWTHTRDFNTPSAWSQPVALPSPGRLSSWPDILADPRGGLLYTAFAVPLNEERGIYLTRSLDGGASWITPTIILDAVAANWDGVDMPRLALDPSQDTLHVVWLHKLPPGGVGDQEVYYARSADRGVTWSPPALIAKGNVDWPEIAVGAPNQVYIAWNEYVTPRRPDSSTPMSVWGKFSPDGGQRWTAPLNIRSLQQVSGPVGLTGDGSGRLHIVAVGKASGEESTLFSVEWNGQDWEERVALGLRRQAAAGNSAVAAVAPDQGKMIVLLRQRSRAEDGSPLQGIDATGRDLPAGQAITVPTFTPQPTPTRQALPTIQPTATPRPQLNSSTRQSVSDSSGLNPFVLGGVFAAIVVVAIVAGTIWIRRR